MEALPERTPGALPAALLELAADKSHKVRSALMKLLKARPHAGHTSALVTLASVQSSPSHSKSAARRI